MSKLNEVIIIITWDISVKCNCSIYEIYIYFFNHSFLILHKFFFVELKTSPTIHEQRQKLERAKMGDLLKAKIQQRPDRQELVRQHILEGKFSKCLTFVFLNFIGYT